MLKYWKKALTAAVMGVMMSVLLLGCGDDNVAKKFIHIATGGTAGTYYPIGGAIAEILNKDIPGMNASAQSTGASVSNINLIKADDVELAIVQNDIAYYAVNATEMFSNNNKLTNLKAITALYPETCQWVTLDTSGIKSISDLKGKRVAVGAIGSGAEANARQILTAYGITYNDIDVQYLSFAEGANALKDGNVDAAFLTAGYPTAAVQDIASQNKIRILPIDDDKAAALAGMYPFYTKTKIPAGTYTGFDEEVSTVSVMAILIANDTVDADLGYQIAKSIFSNLDRLKSTHAAMANVDKSKAMEGLPLDMNKGAEKFFKE